MIVRVEPTAVRLDGRTVTTEQEIYDAVNGRAAAVVDLAPDATSGAAAAAIEGVVLSAPRALELRFRGASLAWNVRTMDRTPHTAVFVRIDKGRVRLRWQTDRPCSVAPSEAEFSIEEARARIAEAARAACGGVRCIDHVDVMVDDVRLPFANVVEVVEGFSQSSVRAVTPVSVATASSPQGVLVTWRGREYARSAVGLSPLEWPSLCGQSVGFPSNQLDLTPASACFQRVAVHDPNVVEWMPLKVTVTNDGTIRVAARGAVPYQTWCPGIAAREVRDESVLACVQTMVANVRWAPFGGYVYERAAFVASVPPERGDGGCWRPRAQRRVTTP